MVPQTGAISSPTHFQRVLYFYHMNYYAILKEHSQVTHKLQPKQFQIALEKLSVMKFPVVAIKTYFYMRFVLCANIEINQ